MALKRIRLGGPSSAAMCAATCRSAMGDRGRACPVERKDGERHYWLACVRLAERRASGFTSGAGSVSRTGEENE